MDHRRHSSQRSRPSFDSAVEWLPRISPSAAIEMIERQRRTGFHGLMAMLLRTSRTMGDPEACRPETAGNGRDRGRRSREEVVGLARDHMASDDLGHGDDSLLEAERPLVGMAVDLDADEYGSPGRHDRAVGPRDRPRCILPVPGASRDAGKGEGDRPILSARSMLLSRLRPPGAPRRSGSRWRPSPFWHDCSSWGQRRA